MVNANARVGKPETTSVVAGSVTFLTSKSHESAVLNEAYTVVPIAGRFFPQSADLNFVVMATVEGLQTLP